MSITPFTRDLAMSISSSQSVTAFHNGQSGTPGRSRLNARTQQRRSDDADETDKTNETDEASSSTEKEEAGCLCRRFVAALRLGPGTAAAQAVKHNHHVAIPDAQRAHTLEKGHNTTSRGLNPHRLPGVWARIGRTDLNRGSLPGIILTRLVIVRSHYTHCIAVT